MALPQRKGHSVDVGVYRDGRASCEACSPRRTTATCCTADTLIDGRGQGQLTDFGLPQLADTLSRRDSVSGTPAYMAPEQQAGEQVTVRSDVYALGLVLYKLFTAKRPFPAGM